MKIAFAILGTLAAAQLAVPAQAADPRMNRHTTVTQVHGPLKVLPHHKAKYCKKVWKHHKRVKKCWYH
jgi:hypothetical protein